MKSTAKVVFVNILIAIVIAIFFRTWVISVYKIHTTSMLPSLWVGDFILAYKLKFKLPGSLLDKVQRGDLVVINGTSTKNTNYVKRVLGLPGDKIYIKKSQIFINDKVLEYSESDEQLKFEGMQYYKVVREKLPYKEFNILIKKEVNTEDYGPVIVPPDHVFVLGDNRDTSEDSRLWGSVALEEIHASVLNVWLSVDWSEKSFLQFLPKVRWRRIGKAID